MIRHLFIFCFSLLLLSCDSTHQTKPDELTAITLSNNNAEAESPFATVDHLGNAVISWVETQNQINSFYYAVSKNNGESFSQPILVPTANGLSAHHESMPKIAFKADGTAFVVYQKRKPTPKNGYAGAIYYTQKSSPDSSWSKPQFLHGDTNAGIGRSFFDIAQLSNGEIGAIWLDGRKKSRKGSTLFFVKTTKNSLNNEVEIAQKTCQCCRTELFIDAEKNINICFRDIIQDSIRDIAYIKSTDNGNSFSKPEIISADNWIVDGCPHTGPTLFNNKNGIGSLWFTKGGDEGVYETSNSSNGKFSPRKIFSPHARHPQAITNSKATTAIVWDEFFKTESSYIKKVGLQIRGEEVSTSYITKNHVDASYPVITSTKNGSFVIAWNQKSEDKSEIKYIKIN